MHPNTMKRTKTWVLDLMGWIGCVRCNKFWHDFVARTFALIAPVQYVLHHISCSYEIIRNELKHYSTPENMSLGSNGLDRARSLRKITMWLRGTNFCINCTSSPCFAPSFMQLRNDLKCTQTLWNRPKHKFRVQWDGSSVFIVKKLQHDFVARTFALIAPVDPVLHRVPCSYETIPNAPKHYGSSASVAKNYNVTSWHEPLH
jgi:hypothetical protein